VFGGDLITHEFKYFLYTTTPLEIYFNQMNLLNHIFEIFRITKKGLLVSGGELTNSVSKLLHYTTRPLEKSCDQCNLVKHIPKTLLENQKE
jgi:hypothetical protein